MAGYAPPMRGALLATGLVSLVGSPFGGYSNNLSSITAAMCTNLFEQAVHIKSNAR